MTFGRRFGAGLVWNQLSRVLELGAATLASVLAARAFGATSFGVYSIALSVVQLSTFGTSFGLNEVLNVHVPRLKGSPGRIAFLLRALLWLRGGVALALAAVLALAAPWIAAAWHEPALAPLLRVAALYAFFYNVSLLLEYFLVGSLDVPSVSRVRIAVQLLGLAAAAGALAWHWPPRTLLAALAANAALGVVWLAWGARRALRPPGEPFDLATLRTFGLSVWVTNFLTFFLGRQSDVLLIGYFRPGTDEAGCYAAATLLAMLLASALLMGAEGVSLAAFSELEQRVDRAGIGRLWQLHLKLDALLSLPLLAFGWRFAPEIVRAVYSTSFGPAAGLLAAYALVWMLVRALGGGTNMTVLYAMNEPKLPLILYGVSGAANLALNLVLVPRFGAAGAVFGTGLAIVGSSLASALLVGRRTGASPPLGFVARVLIACGAALLALQWLPRPAGIPGLVVAAAVGLVVCLAALKLLRPLDADDRRLLERLHPRLGAIAARLT